MFGGSFAGSIEEASTSASRALYWSPGRESREVQASLSFRAKRQRLLRARNGRIGGRTERGKAVARSYSLLKHPR